MKGKLILTDIQSPVEGMKILTCSSHIGGNASIGTLVNNPANHMWNVKLPSSKILPFGLSELSQIVVEYTERYNLNVAVDGFKTATLPLHPDDWKWAIEHIGEEVEFEIEAYTCSCGATCWGLENGDKCLKKQPDIEAKLIHPTPVMYTEEEVKSYLEILARIPALGFGFNLDDWWNEHKKK